MNKKEEELGRKCYPFRNDRIKKLPIETRRELFELVKDDVRTAIENNGYSDQITLDMIAECSELEEYWGLVD